MRFALFLCVACASSSTSAPAPAATTVAAPPIGPLYYEADFNHQRCAFSEINCGTRKPGDPCTVEGERCTFSCATEILVCKRH